MPELFIKISAFIVGTLLIFLISPGSIRKPGSHGFYRFFAFESILALLVWNADYWFINVFSANQVISWILLLGSVLLAAHGFYLLRFAGKPKGNIENTSVLVQKGAYRFIRHPLYSSLILLSLGIFFKQISWTGVFLVLLAFTLIDITASIEEKENVARLGQQYADYMKKTKKFIPRLF
jgi:protein-S-isoprenylcysteine O-methyltransferase Ste14